MKNKKYHTSEQLQNSNDNNREENKIDNPNTPCFFTLICVWLSYWIVSSFSFISLPFRTNILDR
jgi:hypothetical protein